MSHALGLLEVTRVAGALDHLDARRSGSRRPCGGRCRRTWRRAPPTISSTGIASSPRRSQFDGCAPCPSTAELLREGFDRVVGAAFLEPRPLGRQRGEQRLREPAFEERVDAVALDLLREALVGVASRGALGGRRRYRATRSPARGRRTSVGSVERELQAQPSTHASSRRRWRAGRRRRARAPSSTKSRPSGTATERDRRVHSTSATGAHERRRLREAVHDRPASRHPRRHPRMTRDATTAFARTLVDEWVRARRHRRVPRARVALGAARARARRRRPHPTARAPRRALGVVLRARAARRRRAVPRSCCARREPPAANFHPAVLEAHHARVPLIVCTADRPPELRDTGAGQTVDQVKLYGDAVRWFCDAGCPTTATAPARRGGRWRRARSPTRSAHRPDRCTCNLPFREPLVPTGEQLVDAPGRSDDRPWTATGSRCARAVDRDARRAAHADRATAPRPDRGRLGRRRADRRRCCASPTSPAGRCSPIRSRTCGCRAPSRPTTRCSAVPGFADGAPPRRRVRIGGPITNKVSCSGSTPSVDQVLVDPDGAWLDPAARGERAHGGRPRAAARRARPRCGNRRDGRRGVSPARWTDADARARDRRVWSTAGTSRSKDASRATSRRGARRADRWWSRRACPPASPPPSTSSRAGSGRR